MTPERQHEALFRVHRNLAACATEAAFATDEKSLFNDICNMLVGSELFRFAWFGYARAGRMAEPIAWSTDERGFLDDLKLALSKEDYEDPAAVCLRTRDVCWIEDVAAHTGLGPMWPALLRCGYTSVISVPVMSEDDPYAALTLYYDDPEMCGQSTVDVLKEKVRQVRAVFAARPLNPPSGSLEEEVRGLIDALPVTVGLCNGQGSLLHLNRRMIETTGYTVEDHLYRSALQSYVHPDDRDMMYVISAQGFAQGVPFEFEVRHLRKDNQYHWVLVHITPIRDKEGNISRWVTTGTDIQKLKQAEEKLRQSEAELRQILDLAPQHVYVLGAAPDATRFYANQAALDYFGMTYEEWRTRDLREIFHPDDWVRANTGTESQVADGVLHEVEIRLRGKDGTYRWFLSRRSPLRDEQGRLTRWYVAATDINDRRIAEQRLQDENVALREEIDKASMFEEIVGSSAPLKKVLSRISRVAPTDSSVLITGETGTGKELVARAIHRRSRRSSHPFVSVNCAAIPRDLIASELFGHEKGAFTGAAQRRLGRFELAEKGTIFLDEVGELPAETQVALLRVLQEREFERVGGTGPMQADVRVVAATNRDLEAAIGAGTFRSDLYYRLNVFPIEVPTLRERNEDIPLLVAYFLNRYARKAGRQFTAVDKQSLDLLQSYAWPGNIRELQNVIERSVIVSDEEIFSVDESWLSRQHRTHEPKNLLELPQRLAAQEKEIIEAALRECGGRVSGATGAAARLGMPGSTLESKIKSLKIEKKRFRT